MYFHAVAYFPTYRMFVKLFNHFHFIVLVWVCVEISHPLSCINIRYWYWMQFRFTYSKSVHRLYKRLIVFRSIFFIHHHSRHSTAGCIRNFISIRKCLPLTPVHLENYCHIYSSGTSFILGAIVVNAKVHKHIQTQHTPDINQIILAEWFQPIEVEFVFINLIKHIPHWMNGTCGPYILVCRMIVVSFSNKTIAEEIVLSY